RLQDRHVARERVLAGRMNLAEHEDVLAPELGDLHGDLRVHVEVLEPARDLFANGASGETSRLDEADVRVVERPIRVERDRLRQILFAKDDDVQDVLWTGDILRRGGRVRRGRGRLRGARRQRDEQR